MRKYGHHKHEYTTNLSCKLLKLSNSKNVHSVIGTKIMFVFIKQKSELLNVSACVSLYMCNACQT